MCGIVGMARSKERVNLALIETMRDTMTHRGPDDRGSWSSDDGRVGFGHRRLSIIDLSPKGHQPMRSRDGNVCITFNGEIYNFLELRADLQRLGYTFDSESDTEVLLAAYAEWGTDALARLNGMFAFAMYDSLRKRLFVARDRAGEKPLFYRHADGGFAFASELKALMADPALQRRTVKAIGRHGRRRFAMHGYTRNHHASAKKRHGRRHSGGKEFLALEVARRAHNVLRSPLERRVASQHDTDILMMCDGVGNVPQCARTHQVIVPHEDDVIAQRACNNFADVAVEADVFAVFEIANFLRSRTV